jgi:hypothetical protein
MDILLVADTTVRVNREVTTATRANSLATTRTAQISQIIATDRKCLASLSTPKTPPLLMEVVLTRTTSTVKCRVIKIPTILIPAVF